MGVRDWFKKGAKKAKELGEKVGTAIEEKLDEIEDTKKFEAEQKEKQNNPVRYYENLIQTNPENIVKLNSIHGERLIPDSVYRELSIRAVSRNPKVFSLLDENMQKDETICKIAKTMTLPTVTNGNEKLHESIKIDGFDAENYITSHNDSYRDAVDALKEEDRAKMSDEVKKEIDEAFEQGRAKEIEDNKSFGEKIIDKAENFYELIESKLEEIVEKQASVETNESAPTQNEEIVEAEQGLQTTNETPDGPETGDGNKKEGSLFSRVMGEFRAIFSANPEKGNEQERVVENDSPEVEQITREEPEVEAHTNEVEQESRESEAVAPVIGESVVEAMIDGAQIEQSNTEAPSVEVPIVDMNVENVHVKGTPIIEAPIVEAPVIEVAAQEASVSQTPTEEVEQENTAPKTEAPEVETQSRETKRENIASETEVSSIEASKQESTKLKITAEEKETIKKEVIAELVALFGPNILKKSNAKWLLRDGVQNRINKLMGEKAAQKRGESSAKQEQVNAEQEAKNSENTTKREGSKIESVNKGQQNVVPPVTENPNKEKPTVERVSREEILQATEPTVEAHVVEPGVQAKVEKVEIEPTVEAPTESVAQDGPPMILSEAMKNFYSAFGELQKVVSSGSKNNGKASITKMMRNLENDYRLGKYNEQEFGDLQAFLELAAEEKTTNMQNKNVSGKEMMSKILNDKELEQLGIEMGKE